MYISLIILENSSTSINKVKDKTHIPILYMKMFLVGAAVPPPNLVLKPGETTLANIEFYLTVPDGDLEFEIFGSSGNFVS